MIYILTTLTVALIAFLVIQRVVRNERVRRYQLTGLLNEAERQCATLRSDLQAAEARANDAEDYSEGCIDEITALTAQLTKLQTPRAATKPKKPRGGSKKKA